MLILQLSMFHFSSGSAVTLDLHFHISLPFNTTKFALTCEFRNKEECYITNENCCVQNCATGTSVLIVSVFHHSVMHHSFVDYIYLDTDERRRFAQVSREYLIEQLQFTGDESVTSTNVKLSLISITRAKELVWVVQRDDVSQTWKQWNNYTDDVGNGC